MRRAATPNRALGALRRLPVVVFVSAIVPRLSRRPRCPSRSSPPHFGRSSRVRPFGALQLSADPPAPDRASHRACPAGHGASSARVNVASVLDRMCALEGGRRGRRRGRAARNDVQTGRRFRRRSKGGGANVRSGTIARRSQGNWEQLRSPESAGYVRTHPQVRVVAPAAAGSSLIAHPSNPCR